VKSKASWVSVVVGVGLGIGAIGPASANQLVNGGFEMGDLTGWTVTGNTGFIGVQCPGPGPTVFQGNCSAFAGPVGSLGFLSQSFSTQPGQPLAISFAWLPDGGTPSEFSVELDMGTANQRTLLDILNPSASGFRVGTLFSTARGTTTTLSFNLRDDPGFIFLDAVSVVPEPASIALLGIGLVGLWAGRARKRQ